MWSGIATGTITLLKMTVLSPAKAAASEVIVVTPPESLLGVAALERGFSTADLNDVLSLAAEMGNVQELQAASFAFFPRGKNDGFERCVHFPPCLYAAGHILISTVLITAAAILRVQFLYIQKRGPTDEGNADNTRPFPSPGPHTRNKQPGDTDRTLSCAKHKTLEHRISISLLISHGNQCVHRVSLEEEFL